MLIISNTLSIPSKELEFTYVRSSGPGGQNVNKTNTCAVLKWNIVNSRVLTQPLKERLVKRLFHRISKAGCLIIKSDKFRHRERNTSECKERLKKLILTYSKVPKKRKPTKASKASREKRLKLKKAHGKTKELRKKPQ